MKYRVEHSVPHHAGSRTYKLSAGTIRYCTGSSGSLRIQHLPTRGLQHCQACAWLFYGNSDLKLVYLVFCFFLTQLVNLILVLSLKYPQRDVQKNRKVPVLSCVCAQCRCHCSPSWVTPASSCWGRGTAQAQGATWHGAGATIIWLQMRCGFCFRVTSTLGTGRDR